MRVSRMRAWAKGSGAAAAVVEGAVVVPGVAGALGAAVVAVELEAVVELGSSSSVVVVARRVVVVARRVVLVEEVSSVSTLAGSSRVITTMEVTAATKAIRPPRIRTRADATDGS